MMRYPSASSAIDTEVRMLRSSSTRAMVDIHWLLLIATIRLKKSPTHKLAERCRTVSEKRARPVGRGNNRILAAVYAPPWVNRVPYFGMIFSYPPHRGIGVGGMVGYAMRRMPRQRPSQDQREFLELLRDLGPRDNSQTAAIRRGTKRACQVRGWVEWRCLDDLSGLRAWHLTAPGRNALNSPPRRVDSRDPAPLPID